MADRSICAGLLAHVDAGKTTLSEAILYKSGELRRLGRVDHGNTYLDSNGIERNRGITVFSKQAHFNAGRTAVTILDTPGHVDFSSEMERALSVIDYALLIISASEGIQNHTETLWRLLKERQIPVIVFVNKMDMAVRGRDRIIEELVSSFGRGFADFSEMRGDAFVDEVTLADPYLADRVLLDEELTDGDIVGSVKQRRLFPCLFGSALRLEGIDSLMECIDRFTCENPEFRNEEFGARVFKISRDTSGERLTYMRLTGGELRTREELCGKDRCGEQWREKINQIRIYSGMKYEALSCAGAGDMIAVTGLSRTLPGDALGIAEAAQGASLEPFIMHSVKADGYCDGRPAPDPVILLRDLRQLGEEDPELHIDRNAQTGEVTLRLMGRIQLEVLRQLIKDRFGYSVSFGPRQVLYKETVSQTFEGAGHFEPLRHYAEVHLIVEPAERGSGITLESILPEDVLAGSWQRLILSYLDGKEHAGPLTGAPVTDAKIILAAGRAHEKHTSGGDFREAAQRALRHALMNARQAGKAVLLEPFTDFRFELDPCQLGRVMTDIEQLGGSISRIDQSEDEASVSGKAPSAALSDYLADFAAATGGTGHCTMRSSGYEDCINSEKIIAESGYDPERDTANTGASVFADHGGSNIIPWQDAMKHMHIGPVLKKGDVGETAREIQAQARREAFRRAAVSDAELMRIFERTYGKPERKLYRTAEEKRFERTGGGRDDARNLEIRSRHMKNGTEEQNAPAAPEVLLIDGYNVINADRTLRELASEDVGAARDQLVDRLINYRGYTQCELTVVFDAYRASRASAHEEKLTGISVVYTAEGELADIRIGRMASGYGKDRKVTIVSSDALVQQNALVNSSLRMSSAEFLRVLGDIEEEIRIAMSELSD